MTLPPPLPIKKPTDRASIWQLVLGVIGITMSLLSFLGLLLLSHLPAANTGSSTLNSAGITPLLWMTGLLAVLAVPSILFASRSIHDHPSPLITVGPRFLPFSAIAVVLWAALAYIGENAARWKLSINITSPLNILIVAIPILLLLTLGLYRLTFGSQQRAWGMINVAAFLTMQVVFFLEMIVILIVVVLAGVWLFKQPQFASYLSLLMTQKNITVQSLAPLFNQLTTLLNQPGLYAVVVLVFCLLVPMIEEGFKPLGVWLIAGKKLTPTQGFAAGLLSGATFGLLESLSLMSMVSGSTWLVTAVARIGTGLLHTLTAGLSGWALAKTLQDQKYIRLALTYTGVVLLHGSWNLFAVLMGIGKVAIPIKYDFINRLMDFSPWALSILVGLMFAALILMNARLRKQSNPPALTEFSDTLDHSIE